MVEMYRVDKLLDQTRSVECSIVLHRAAGARGFSTDVKQSYIDRGSYFAEINEYLGKGRINPNCAMGIGKHPLIAAMDGYKRVVPLDDEMAAIYLECETYLLSEARRVYSGLDYALADLEAQIKQAAMMFMLEVAVADE